MRSESGIDNTFPSIVTCNVWLMKVVILRWLMIGCTYDSSTYKIYIKQEILLCYSWRPTRSKTWNWSSYSLKPTCFKQNNSFEASVLGRINLHCFKLGRDVINSSQFSFCWRHNWGFVWRRWRRNGCHGRRRSAPFEIRIELMNILMMMMMITWVKAAYCIESESEFMVEHGPLK